MDSLDSSKTAHIQGAISENGTASTSHLSDQLIEVASKTEEAFQDTVNSSEGGLVDLFGGIELTAQENAAHEKVALGVQMESAGLQRESEGIETESRGKETESRGVEIESRGIEIESRGIETESRGKETESRGVEIESRGIETESRGVETESRGIEAESRGIETESRGDQTVSVGMTTAAIESNAKDDYKVTINDIDSKIVTIETMTNHIEENGFIVFKTSSGEYESKAWKDASPAQRQAAKDANQVGIFHNGKPLLHPQCGIPKGSQIKFKGKLHPVHHLDPKQTELFNLALTQLIQAQQTAKKEESKAKESFNGGTWKEQRVVSVVVLPTSTQEVKSKEKQTEKREVAPERTERRALEKAIVQERLRQERAKQKTERILHREQARLQQDILKSGITADCIKRGHLLAQIQRAMLYKAPDHRSL